MADRSIKVFVSSTFIDLESHRKAAEKAVLGLKQRSMSMEYLGAVDAEPVEASLGMVEECDVFVGLYAWRYGHIPEGSEISITEQEYDHATRLNKPRLLFLVKEDYLWNPKLIETGEPGEKLKKFKSKLQAGRVRAEFTDMNDLRAGLTQALVNWILPGLSAGGAASQAVTDDLALHGYSLFRKVRYGQIRIFDDRIFDLDDMYVTLRLESNPELWHRYGQAELARKLAKGTPPERIREIMLEENPGALQTTGGETAAGLTIDNILAETRRAVILGEAGSGKTTLLRQMAGRTAVSEQGPIPVLLPVREWIRHSVSDPIASFVKHLENEPTGLDEGTIEALGEALKRKWDGGGVLLMLDGLDEVDDDEYGRACEWLNSLRDSGNSVLVSCRRSCFRPLLDGELWWSFAINSFGKEERGQFIRHYYRKRDSEAELLADRIEGGHRLRSLGQNPLLLGLLCYVDEKSKGDLPQERVVLYETCIAVLLERRAHQRYKGLGQEKRDFLAEIAYRFFDSGEKSEREWMPSRKVTEHLRKWLASRPDLAEALPAGEAVEFLSDISEQNSLLMPVGSASYCFPHRSFQEYFAAQYILNQGVSISDLVERFAKDAFWFETLCLYAGMVPDATDLVNELGKAGHLELALKVTTDAAKVVWANLDKQKLNWKIRREALEKPVLAEPDRSKTEELTDLYQGILQGRWSDPNGNVRYSAMIALEKLGTPRALKLVKSVHVIPPEILSGASPYQYEDKLRSRHYSINSSRMPPNMALVPGGTFKLGETRKKAQVQDFFLSVFPVTNLEYAKFMADAGPADQRAVSRRGDLRQSGRIQKAPEFLSDNRFNHPQQPVVGVSFFDALAYCEWLTLARKDGFEYRLPTEEEWEHAARGPDGDEFSFGGWDEDMLRWDSILIYENGLTVGPARVNSVFSKNISGFGIFDMSANIWEWTSSKYNKNGDERVLRGGSWFDLNPDIFRCAFRDWVEPDFRISNFGFRVARSR